MSEWTNRDDRQADAKAQYEHIMTTPAPPAIGSYIDAGVIGFVFGEMWRRGVLTPRDRRWLTLACVGAADNGSHSLFRLRTPGSKARPAYPDLREARMQSHYTCRC